LSLKSVRAVARTVTVLHQGSAPAEGDMNTIRHNPAVAEAYPGEAQR
jgi:ABC-type uncharacterized transport system ATPase subunit